MLPPDKHDLQRLIDDLQLDAETRLHMLERHPRVVHFLASLQLVADLPAYWDIHTPALIQQFFQHPQPDLLARAVRLLAKAHLVTSVLVEQLIRHPDLPLLVHYLKRLAGHSHELFRQYAWYLTQHPELLQLIPQLNELLCQTIPTPEPWQLLFGRDTGWQHQLALQKLAGTSMVTPAVAEGLRQHDAPHACADLLRLLHRTQATHPIHRGVSPHTRVPHARLFSVAPHGIA